MREVPFMDPEGEEPVMCFACGCWYEPPESGKGPHEECANQACSCHQPYWDTIPESLKRELWGK